MMDNTMMDADAPAAPVAHWARSLPPRFGMMRDSSSAGDMVPSLTKGELSVMTGPPVPKLDGDLMLDVYTHRSLQGSDEPSTTDNMRLAELGEQVMRLVVTWVLFSRRPPLSADDIESERTQYLSEANVNSWVSRYSMRSKVRVAPGQQGILDSPEETRLLFASYVGAVFLQHGMKECNAWISRLMEPSSEPPPLPGADAAHGGPSFDQAPPPWPSQQPYQPIAAPPPPPNMPPPPPPSFPPPPNPPPPAFASSDVASSATMPSSSGYSNPYATPPSFGSSASDPARVAFLPMFNQAATQRRLTVDYPSTFTGPPHAGRWVVKCMVNNIQKGEAAGASKQLAKEEAARQAYLAMGWDARPGSANYTRASSEYPPVPPSHTPASYTRPDPVKEEDSDMASSISPMSSISNQGAPSYPQQPFSPYGSSGPQAGTSAFASAQPSTTFLPLFNQTATQRRLIVEYPSEFAGPAHAGRWTVKCLVNGIVKGQGQGSSKQLAKEEAAKQAYYAMGWAPR